MKRVSRNILYISIVILAFVFVILIVGEVKQKTQAGSENVRMDEASQKVSLARNLTDKMNLDGVDYLSKTNKRKWDRDTQRLSKKQFKGAIVGIKNNQVIFSKSFGYSNAKAGSRFALNSAFSVGQYQEFLNNAMLVELMQQKKINLNKKLRGYLPELNSIGNPTVRDFLMGNTKLYSNKKDVLSKNTKTIHLTKIYSYRKYSSNMVLVNELVKSLLIETIHQTSYEKAVKDLLVHPLSLVDTRVYLEDDHHANDVIGYKYEKRGRQLVQSEPIKMDGVMAGGKQLKMTLTDVLSSLGQILDNQLFSKRYNQVFYSMDIEKLKTTSEYLKLSSNEFGQYIYVKSSRRGNRIVAIATNYPNKSINESTQINLLYNLLGNE